MTRRRKGFLTLAHESLHELNHRYGLPIVPRYVFVCLLAQSDKGYTLDGVSYLSTSERELAREMHIPQETFRRARIKLVGVGLVGWVVAKNGETPGQLTIPAFDWHLSCEGEYDPLTHRRLATDSPLTQYGSLTPPLPAGTDPKTKTKKPPTPPSADAEGVLEQIRKAIADAFGIDLSGTTASERNEVGKAAKELHEVNANATPAEIKVRVQTMRAKWPNATPYTLVKHWSQFGGNQTNGEVPARLRAGTLEWKKENRPWEVEA